MAKNTKETKYEFDVTIANLEKLITIFFANLLSDGYLQTPPELVNKISTFLNILDRNRYDNDYEISLRLVLLDQLSKAYLVHGIRTTDELIEFTSTDGKYKERIEDFYGEGMDEVTLQTFKQVDLYLSQRINYSYLFKYELPMTNLFEKLRSREFDTLDEINNRFINLIEEASNDLKISSLVNEDNTTDFGLDSSLKDALARTITNLNAPSNTIKTGVKWLNKLLDGGYKANRVYLWLGVYKGWKSGMLLNTVLWGREFNNDIKAKDPSKRPCILYVTMENSADETLERIWSYYIGEDDNLSKYTVDEAFLKLQKAGFNSDDNNKPYIEIRYRSNKSINTNDVENMIDNLADRNLEVCMVVLDYIKRIKAIDRSVSKEIRLELGEVVNDLCNLAKSRNISIVTANQLNREAVRILEERGVDAMKKLGGSQAGESMLPIENADWSGILTKTMLESTGEDYISFKEIATRFKKSKSTITSFSHPMENGMKLKEDLNLASTLSVQNLADGLSNYESGKAAMKKGDIDEEEDYDKIVESSKKNKRGRTSSKVVVTGIKKDELSTGNSLFEDDDDDDII